MFPFCLINASVTDAGGIRSRLVSFPLTLFSSDCHIAFPMFFFKKKKTGSVFPVYQCSCFYALFFFNQICLTVLSCTNQNVNLLSQVLSNSRLWCDWFHFTTLALFELSFSSVTHYFTFINLTTSVVPTIKAGNGKLLPFFFSFLLTLPLRWAASRWILAPA